MTARPTALLFAALALSHLTAQTTAPQQQPPTFKSQANFVRVDVYPTRNGKPVDDLRAEDFEILEDDARQTITAFEHVAVRSTRARPASRRQRSCRLGPW